MNEINVSRLSNLLDRPGECWTPRLLHQIFIKHGCAVVRQVIPAGTLERVRGAVAEAYRHKDDLHVYDTDLAEATKGALTGFEAVDDVVLLKNFLDLVFRNQRYRRHSVSSRRIQGAEAGQEWQKPLSLHLDCQVHAFEFTVNFWIPFENCGLDAPGLQLIPADYRVTREYSGYTGERLRNDEEWNMGYFPQGRFELDAVIRTFGPDAFLRPVMKPGDVIVSSNWLVHASYATPHMKKGRTSMEVRFIGETIDPPITGSSNFFSRIKERLLS